METRNRKRRRPSVKLHQHPSQNLPGTSQQPRQLPSTQMPDQLPPNQQPVQLPPNQQPVQLPLNPSHRLGQWSSNQQSGHQPGQLPLSHQLGDQMQPAASQPDPAVQSVCRVDAEYQTSDTGRSRLHFRWGSSDTSGSSTVA
ncbi:cell division protein ZipA-like [Dreissena polymorpha]|uniref:cell division protein ZipA-like n=1 Tax=Dreissena polymorpha TaxID=45954 RepID=UPI0022654338|nr:cell division protein ZipA-like [Dreissena polymorpha]